MKIAGGALLRRWILPFNRELTLGALAQAPLIPWRWKMDATHWWLKRFFYGPAGLTHMMPGGGNKAAPRDNDYAGARISLHRPCIAFLYPHPALPASGLPGKKGTAVQAHDWEVGPGRASVKDTCEEHAALATSLLDDVLY